MKKQADEEMIHVWKLYNYIFSRGGRAVFQAIGEPKTEYDGIRNIFEEALKHEEFITSCVEKLVKLTVVSGNINKNVITIMILILTLLTIQHY